MPVSNILEPAIATTAASAPTRLCPGSTPAGGAAAPAPKAASRKTIPVDFVLPLDVDGEEVQKAIEARLADASPERIDMLPVIERRAGGRVAVSARHLLRLGDGDFARGKQFIHGLIKLIRARRMRQKWNRQSPH